MTDERKGYPSASSAQRYALCPGSFLLEKQAPPETESPYAESGTRIHDALEGKIHPEELGDDERDVFWMCAKHGSEVAINALGLPRDISPDPIARELRLWDDASPHWSGKLDVLYKIGSRALVIDYKTGRGDVEQAAGNLQLRALAALVSINWPSVESVTVAIVQPLLGQPSACEYMRADLEVAIRETRGVFNRAQMEGQPRVPSLGACKFCRAKTICPEARAAVEMVPAAAPTEASVALMTGEEVARFLSLAPLAEKVIEAVRAEAKRRLESGETIPGWTLKPGAVRETITKPETVFGRFLDAGGTQAQFMPAVTVTKGKLKAALKDATGAKGKHLDEQLSAILDGCTESNQAAASLTKEKS